MILMAKLGIRQIQEQAREIVLHNPDGIRFGELVRQIAEAHPETPRNTIQTQVSGLISRYPNEITKPSKGLFKPIAAESGPVAGNDRLIKAASPGCIVREEDFYNAFGEWLRSDLDEVTAVAALGGASLKGKWGTPDVVGVYKPSVLDLIKFSPEIVSAEIKIDPTQPVVAFGQAIAYRLFSTKSYVVMPSTVSAEDLSRLEALAMLFGLGLVLFDVNLESPNFSIRVRAQRFTPDMFYVNEFADRLRHSAPNMFQQLFS